MDNNEREQSAIVARVLTLNRSLTGVCRVLALLHAFWLLGASMHGPLALAMGISGALASAAWAYAEWLAARIHLDHLIFEDAAQGRFSFARLDEVLGVSPRTIAQRQVGALGLLRRSGMVTVLLVCLLSVTLMI
ncbi:MAG: hypothetical protein H7327_07155 [Herminiimonas sp.]|nr:hypothetical protein [Herminiimonas sp.]